MKYRSKGMKRDLDLLRKLLLYYEAKPDDRMEEGPAIDGYSDLEIKYHLLLMDDGGLIRCERDISSTSNRVIKVYPFSLTWAGHEFLDASRNEKLWHRAKKMAGDKLGSIPFEVLKTLLIQLVKDSIGDIRD
jgi:hypothetical protein